MWPLISPASGALSSAILVLISECPVFHINGVPPARRILSNNAWLAFTSAMMVVPGRSFSTSRAHRIMSWSPQDTALAVDRTDTVAIAVEGDAEIAAAALHLGGQLLEVLRHRWIGMMRRESAVDLLVQDEMLARQLVDDRPDRDADGAVAGVPGHLELAAGLHVLQQPRRIFRQDDLLFDRTFARLEVALGRYLAELEDVGAKERLLAHHHLEAVEIRWIVRTGDHDPAVRLEMPNREVEHRRGGQADSHHVDAGRGQAVDAGLGKLGRAQPAIVPQRHPLAAVATNHGAEGPADRTRIGDMQGIADDAADVVFTQDRRIELMGRLAHYKAPLMNRFQVRGWGRPTPS